MLYSAMRTSVAVKAIILSQEAEDLGTLLTELKGVLDSRIRLQDVSHRETAHFNRADRLIQQAIDSMQDAQNEMVHLISAVRATDSPDMDYDETSN